MNNLFLLFTSIFSISRFGSIIVKSSLHNSFSSIDKKHDTLNILQNSNLPPSITLVSQKDIFGNDLK